jgi:hypothetical protein
MKLKFDQTEQHVWRATTPDGYRFTITKVASGDYETILTHRRRRGILACWKFDSLADVHAWLRREGRAQIDVLR